MLVVEERGRESRGRTLDNMCRRKFCVVMVKHQTVVYKQLRYGINVDIVVIILESDNI